MARLRPSEECLEHPGARLPFDDVAMLDWAGAVVRRYARHDYGESSYQALADGVDRRPYVVVFTMREDTMWIISCRRAYAKERRTYGKKT
jgi:uncharacterized DUF497 family protein